MINYPYCTNGQVSEKTYKVYETKKECHISSSFFDCKLKNTWHSYFINNVMTFLTNNPINTPGITNTIGKKIGPIKKPKIVILDEYINPTVTKYAAKTKGRYKSREIFLFRSHP